MPEQHDTLQERVERLENAVEDIQRLLQQPSERTTQREVPKAPSRRMNPVPAPRPVERPHRNSEIMWKSETWLKMVGIALLLLGVGFLFKFSIDQGWITEPVRVGFALVVGIALFATGLRIHLA